MKKSALALILAVLMAVGLLTIGAAADGRDQLPTEVDDVIMLTQDVTLSSPVNLEAGETLTIEGGGKTININFNGASGVKTAFTGSSSTEVEGVPARVKLVINNVNFVNTSNTQSQGYAVLIGGNSNGTSVEFNNCTFTNLYTAVYVNQYTNGQGAPSIKINDCEYVDTAYGYSIDEVTDGVIVGEVQTVYEGITGNVTEKETFDSVVATVTDNDGVTKVYQSLAKAFADATDFSTIKIVKDFETAEQIKIDDDKEISLDLNGKTVKYTGTDNYAMTLCGGADLTIDDSAAGIGEDGMFWSAARVIAVGNGANGKTNSTGATLTVNDGVISSGQYEEDGDETYHCAIAIRANYQVGGNSVPCKVTINSVINGGIYVFGNGAELNIEDDAVILTKSSYAISGNGTKNTTNDQGNTVINIKGGLIEQNGETGAAIYHPQFGTLNISGDPIITGATGIQLCSGTANISGGTITGEGADSRENKTSDGLISDGAAVSVVNRNYPGGAPKMNISGGAFVSKQSEAVLAYTWNGNEESAWEDASDNVVVSGGSFSSSVAEYVTADFKFELNNKGTFSYYDTAEAALDNAEPGAVIKGIGEQAAVNVFRLKVVYGNGQAD